MCVQRNKALFSKTIVSLCLQNKLNKNEKENVDKIWWNGEKAFMYVNH